MLSEEKDACYLLVDEKKYQFDPILSLCQTKFIHECVLASTGQKSTQLVRVTNAVRPYIYIYSLLRKGPKIV